MRIVAGEWRGRRLAVPKGMALRPTPERVREAWMSILQLELPGALVLDLCAGTGALGLEALSRGAERADFVESDARSLAVLRRNIAALGAGDRCEVHPVDAREFVRRLPAIATRASPSPTVLAFADPPYRTGLAAELAQRWLDRAFSDIFGVEHDAKESLPPGGDRRSYGDTAITLYRS